MKNRSNFRTWPAAAVVLALTSSALQSTRAQTNAVSELKENVAPQNTTLIDPSQKDKKQTPFRYESIDSDFWKTVEDDLSTENYASLIVRGAKQIKNFGEDSEESWEGHLAVGMGLRNLKLYFAATKVFSNIIKKRLGSMVSQKAIQELSIIAQNNGYDKLEIGDDLLVSNEFGIVHPEIQNFISFHVGFYDLVNGYREWAAREFNLIQDNSYWGQKVNYYKSLAEVARGLVDSAEIRLTNIANSPNADSNLKNLANLQIARLNFEKKEYGRAAQYYEALKSEFPLREKGRVLLEFAWTKYYLQDYSKALGILKGLKAPMFDPSIQPERYILEMIIYKQLCYFEEVSKTANEFAKKFGPSIELIRKRKELKTDPVLSAMAMLDLKLQYTANLITQLRTEYDEIKEFDIDAYVGFKDIMAAYASKDRELQQRLYLQIDERMNDVADLVLDVEEQVKFLDYTARLDALRVVPKGEERNYKSERISFVKFDKIYWPVVDEFWMDEIDDLKILIDSKCDGSLPSPPTNRDLIKKFGEEFE